MRKTERKQRRDKLMVEKFHELYDVKRKRIDDVLHEMEWNHFFLDKDYIYSRIFYCKENLDYYNELISCKVK